MAVNFEWRVEFFNVGGVAGIFETRWRPFFEEAVVPTRNHVNLQFGGTNKKGCPGITGSPQSKRFGRPGRNECPGESITLSLCPR